MPDTFNLADDPWIPLRPVERGTRVLVSLRDAVIRAHEWAGYPDDDSQFGPAILRLLTALAYRISPLGNTENEHDFAEALEELRDAGRFDSTRTDEYFDRWAGVFWLFPPCEHERPRWMQNRELANLDTVGIAESRLMPHASPSYAWGNQVVESLPPATAARALLAFMHYGPGGGGAKYPAADPKHGWQNGRLRGSVSAHPCGATLFDTLLLHTVPVGDGRFDCVGHPEWEKGEPPADTPIRVPRSLQEQLTGRWEKAAWLHLDEDGTVNRVCLTSGRRRPDDIREADPYTVMRLAKRKKGNQFVPVPLRSRRGRSIWRDFPTLRAQTETGEHETHILRSLDQLWRKPDRETITAWVFASHRPENAKEHGWDISSITPNILFDRDTEEAVDRFVAFVEATAEELRQQIKDCLTAAGYARKTTPSRSRLQRADASFWSAMEAEFRRIAVAAPDASETAREPVTRAALEAYDEAVAGIGAKTAAENRGSNDKSYRGSNDKSPEVIPIAVARQKFRYRLHDAIRKLEEQEVQHGRSESAL